jgi:hypothetical protein
MSAPPHLLVMARGPPEWGASEAETPRVVAMASGRPIAGRKPADRTSRLDAVGAVGGG